MSFVPANTVRFVPVHVLPIGTMRMAMTFLAVACHLEHPFISDFDFEHSQTAISASYANPFGVLFPGEAALVKLATFDVSRHAPEIGRLAFCFAHGEVTRGPTVNACNRWQQPQIANAEN